MKPSVGSGIFVVSRAKGDQGDNELGSRTESLFGVCQEDWPFLDANHVLGHAQIPSQVTQ